MIQPPRPLNCDHSLTLTQHISNSWLKIIYTLHQVSVLVMQIRACIRSSYIPYRSMKNMVPPPQLTPCHFFSNQHFRKIQKHTPLRHLGTCPSAISKTQDQTKKNGTALCANFLKKRQISGDFEKTKSVGSPSRAQFCEFLKNSKNRGQRTTRTTRIPKI